MLDCFVNIFGVLVGIVVILSFMGSRVANFICVAYKYTSTSVRTTPSVR